MVGNFAVPEVIPGDNDPVPEAVAQVPVDTDDGIKLLELETEVTMLRSRLVDLKLEPLLFKLEDDFIDFVVTASNLRAANFNIEPADRENSKLIIKKIFPAVGTTAAVTSGLACLEMLKLAQGHKNLSVFKTGVIDLSLPSFEFCQPIGAQKKPVSDATLLFLVPSFICVI